MVDDSLVLTVKTLTRVVFPLLYIVAGAVVQRWLSPRLSPASRRLASLMLIAQLLIVGKSIYLEPSSSFEAWLWDPHQEWNVPATLASAQLALVGAVALACAWLAQSRKALQRIYLSGLGLVFLFLAYDEYFTLHEYWATWDYFLALGAVVVAATLLTAARSPRRAWIWHVCLLVGLTISAAGGIQIEQFGSVCGDYGWITIAECPPITIWALEEILEFLGIWLTLVAILGQFSELSPSPSLPVRRAVYAFPVIWILLLLQSAAMQPIARQLSFHQPADVQFELGEHLHAYRIDVADGGLGCHLLLSPGGWEFDGVGYSIALVDQVSKKVVASRSTVAHHRLDFNLAPGYVPVYRQWKRIEYPSPPSTNRALWLVLSLWYEQNDEFVTQRILDGDLKRLSNSQVILTELVIPAEPTIPSAETLAHFDNGFSLDKVNLPDSARAGETLAIEFSWRSDAQGDVDHAQFLHLGHVESGEWFVYDRQPLGARLPTRLWYSGLADSEVWTVPLPDDLAPGRYEVLTGLYRVSDKERVPVTDIDGAPWLDNRVALGTLTLGE